MSLSLVLYIHKMSGIAVSIKKYYIIRQAVYYISGRFLLKYRALITLTGVFYYIIGHVSGEYCIIGWYSI